MSRAVQIEYASINDLPALHRLVESAYRGESARRGWTHEADLLDGQRTDPQLLRDVFDDPHQQMLVARDDNNAVIGCVMVMRLEGEFAYLGMLTVDPALQGSGLGRQLISAAEALARMAGKSSIEMTVIAQRRDLIAWYERCGYHLTGERRPFPYGDDRFGVPKRDDLEFVVLEKHL